MIEPKKIAIGCDHAGFLYKEAIVYQMKRVGYEVTDFGTNSEDSVDYPDFVHPVAKAVENNDSELGVLICGSGNGVAMTANKHQGIRAAIAWNEELSMLARQHNNANVICIPSRFVSKKDALGIVESFIVAEFDGGRHQKRIDKIPLNK